MTDNILSFSAHVAQRKIEEQEAAFLQKNEKFICAVVWNYASLGGNIQANQPHIEDMIQEANIAVLSKLRNGGRDYDEKILNYTGVIRNACLKAITESKTIRVPDFWIRRGNRVKGDYKTFECSDIEIANVSIRSFEDTIIRKMMVEKLMTDMPDKARTVYKLIGHGYSPHQIDKYYGIGHKTVRYWLKKGRDFFEKEMMEDEESKQLTA